MRNFWTVVNHTFITRLQTKSFLISTIITMLLIIGLTNLDRLFDLFDGEAEEAAIVQVVDRTNELYSELENILAQNEAAVAVADYSGEEETALAEEDNILVLYFDEAALPAATFYSNDEDGSELEHALQQVKENRVLLQLELERSELDLLNQPVSFQVEELVTEAGQDGRTTEELFVAAAFVYILLIMLYISVITYGTMIATEVAVEKSSRVMEILISSVSPITQMFGKIIGVALLAFCQIILLATAGGIGYLLRPNAETQEANFIGDILNAGVQIDLVIYAFVFFVLGYFLYASLAAMLGSIVSRAEDVNTVLAPIIYLVMIAFFIAMFGLNSPEAKIVTIMSYIPPFTPMLMFLRIGMLSIPIWEVALSLALLIATIAIVATLAARVYKGGVLMYDRAASFKDIKRALLLARKEK